MLLQLQASLCLSCGCWLCWDLVVLQDPTTLSTNPLWCRLANTALTFSTLITHFWSLCEGAYHLHLSLFRHTRYKLSFMARLHLYLNFSVNEGF